MFKLCSTKLIISATIILKNSNDITKPIFDIHKCIRYFKIGEDSLG